jgi:hypothetical protein
MRADAMALTPDQVRSFRDDGFLHLRGFLPDELVARLRAACLDHFGVGPDLPRSFFRRELDVGKKIPALEWLVRHPPALDVGRELLGGSVLYTYESAAHLGTGCRYWHKDARDTWNAEGSDWTEDYRVVFFGYYLSGHLGRSGGLSLRRGSHRIKDLRGGDLVTLETGPGDLVVFDCRLTHAGNTLRLRPVFRWIPRSLVMPAPQSGASSGLPRLQLLVQTALLRCPWLFLPAPRDRMAIFLAYGGDDAHTRGFFTWLRGSKGYEHLLAYDEPARM